ncbi:MAG: DNA polymerase I, partial [Atopostipes sp.]|nr:DNA polymerase I [Atopostipes sp.]
MTKKKLLLIDGHSIAFRAFYALHSQLERMKNSAGLHTNALYGFHNMLENVMNKEKPSHAMVAFDAGSTTFRNEFFEEYKGGRDSMPSELSEQIPYLKEMLDAYSLKYYELENYEADDIIGTLSKKAEEEGFEVVIVTGDKDLTQLSTDHVRVDYTVKGVSQLEGYTPEKVKELMGVWPDQVVDYLGLSGDPSDNIPGVTGVGDKTAIKLLEKYGSMEKVYENIDEMNQSKRKENLIHEKETALLSQKLAQIDVDSPIEIKVDETSYSGKDIEKLIDFYKEMDFNSQLEKLDTEAYMDYLGKESNAKEIDFEFVEEITEEMFANQTSLYLEMLEENYHQADIQALAWGDNEKVYLTDIETALNSEVFKEYIQNEKKEKITYDLKAFYVALLQRGMQLEGVIFDSVLASYLLTGEDTSSGDLADISEKHGYSGILPDEAVYGKGKSKGLPEDKEKMHAHIASKVDALFMMREKIEEELSENEQEDLLHEIEMPLAYILGDMEIDGIQVDIE